MPNSNSTPIKGDNGGGFDSGSGDTLYAYIPYATDPTKSSSFTLNLEGGTSNFDPGSDILYPTDPNEPTPAM